MHTREDSGIQFMIYDVQKKTNHNCILGVVFISKGMLIFYCRSWYTAGTLKCVGLMHICDATQPKKNFRFFAAKEEFILKLQMKSLNLGMHITLEIINSLKPFFSSSG